MFDPYTEEGMRRLDNLVAALSAVALVIVLVIMAKVI